MAAASVIVFPVGSDAPVYLVGRVQVLGHREQKIGEGKVFTRREIGEVEVAAVAAFPRHSDEAARSGRW
jgi:hypothetical protein